MTVIRLSTRNCRFKGGEGVHLGPVVASLSWLRHVGPDGRVDRAWGFFARKSEWRPIEPSPLKGSAWWEGPAAAEGVSVSTLGPEDFA